MEQLSSSSGGEGEAQQYSLVSDEELQAAADRVGRSTSIEFGYLNPIPPEGDSWDTWVIERGVEAAVREDRVIDNRTARYIASQLHEGQRSALYSLASTGNIDLSRVQEELIYRFYDQTVQVQGWIEQLGAYCRHRQDKGPVEGWSEHAATQDRADLERLRRTRTIAELDELFGEPVAEEAGDVGELGWFGQLRHDGRPGGLVISQDEQGFRHVWETDSDTELAERWAAINDEYSRFYDERGERETAADDET